jgi:hypothetical protein
VGSRGSGLGGCAAREGGVVKKREKKNEITTPSTLK